MWGSGVTALPRAVGEGGWRSWPVVGGVTGEVVCVCVCVCARACVCRECGVGEGARGGGSQLARRRRPPAAPVPWKEAGRERGR